MSVLLSDLITDAQTYSDMVGSGFVSPAQWMAFANARQEELYQVVSTTFADTFYKHVDFSVTGNANEVPIGPSGSSIASDFGMFKGLDIDPTLPSTRRPIHRFNFNDRDNGSTTYSVLGCDPKYRVVSRSILVLEPPERANGNYRLYYINRPITFANTSDLMMVELEPWREYISQAMARKALLKEESDISGVDERIAQIRQDILTAVETDTAEQNAISDVEGDYTDNAWPYLR